MFQITGWEQNQLSCASNLEKHIRHDIVMEPHIYITADPERAAMLVCSDKAQQGGKSEICGNLRPISGEIGRNCAWIGVGNGA